MNTITLTAPDISCRHCKTAIEREVGAMEGVETCSVDIAVRQVTVRFDPTHTTTEKILHTLDEEGYPVEV